MSKQLTLYGQLSLLLEGVMWMSLETISSWSRLSTGIAATLRIATEQADEELARRAVAMRDRMQVGENCAHVVFCGLFSAGKSSLLNELCGTQLATGAIPTTAIVTQLELPATDGRVVLLDTPGIDSTNAAHQKATQTALWLADGVVLVADYAHVESEGTLQFAHDLSAQGQPFVFVVHQMDKHYEVELPFESFRMRLEQTLSDWDIHCEKIFYTATPAHIAAPVLGAQRNDLPQLYQWLNGLAAQAQLLTAASLQRNLSAALRDFVQRQFAVAIEATELTLLETLGFVPFSPAEATSLLANFQQQQQDLADQMAARQTALNIAMDELRQEFVRKVELAQIAPYGTTERGRQYIESLRPGFRVSRLASRAKTEQGVTHRRDEFVTDLCNRVHQYLTLPVGNDLRAWLREAVPEDGEIAELSKYVDALGVPLDGPMVARVVNEGALLSASYPYQFVKDVVAQVKGRVQAQLDLFWDAVWQGRRQAVAQASLPLQQQSQRLDRESAALRGWLNVHQELEQALAELEGGLVDE
ncbi:GTP-binding protein [Alicyclobacillaceae bacterium I2511]|jgi:small GTP-binding protein|nr:GTP-binding protein [Alicyclobacillaceae bacterium I2511]